MNREELGQDMIHEGRLSEFHQKNGNSYMYSWHHARYMELKAKYNRLYNS